MKEIINIEVSPVRQRHFLTAPSLLAENTLRYEYTRVVQTQSYRMSKKEIPSNLAASAWPISSILVAAEMLINRAAVGRSKTVNFIRPGFKKTRYRG